jgi:hypothetical protein
MKTRWVPTEKKLKEIGAELEIPPENSKGTLNRRSGCRFLKFKVCYTAKKPLIRECEHFTEGQEMSKSREHFRHLLSSWVLFLNFLSNNNSIEFFIIYAPSQQPQANYRHSIV